MKDQAFFLHDAWRICVGGKIVAAEFNDKGSALAGIEVERRRQLKKSRPKTLEELSHG